MTERVFFASEANFPSEGTGGFVAYFPELFAEIIAVAKSALHGYFSNIHITVLQQLYGMIDPQPQ